MNIEVAAFTVSEKSINIEENSVNPGRMALSGMSLFRYIVFS